MQFFIYEEYMEFVILGIKSIITHSHRYVLYIYMVITERSNLSIIHFQLIIKHFSKRRVS